MSDFARKVVRWQRLHGRHDLPWQRSRDPYRIWLSEVMLQQTRVETVLPYFDRFLERFPGVEALARAPAVVFFTGIPLRTVHVHGERGYRETLMAAGRAAQNLWLSARALALCAHCVAEFYDDEVNALLDIDGLDELALAVCLVGHPTQSS